MDRRDAIVPAYKYFSGSSQNNGVSDNAPYIVGLDLRNPMNHGALIRLGANIGARKVFFTSDPTHFSMTKIKKSAGSSHTSMDFVFTSFEKIVEEIPEDYAWIAIETSKKATNLYETKLPEKCVFIAGNESYGLPDKVIGHCGYQVFIPMKGNTKSMNVSHALAVTIFEWLRQRDY